jgi:hypothetical protein
MAKQTVGHRYKMGLHFGLCHAPIDALTRISSDDRIAWSGNVTTTGNVVVSAPNLFGGDEKEGGLSGYFEALFGDDAQGYSPYLTAKIGAPIPAYRGIFSLVWAGGYIASNNPYIKPIAFRVRRILQGWSGGTAWYSAKAAIGAEDMNPAHIIYECLTNRRWGMGYPTDTIDEPSFMAAADALYTESFGLSFKWNREERLQEFMQMVANHIAGVIALDPASGKFVLRLIRNDYDPDDLDTFGPTDIAELTSVQRAMWGETVNEVTVIYTDPETSKESPVTVQDLANISIQGIVSQTVRYDGIRNRNLAARVAQRDLDASTIPLARVALKGNRRLGVLYPGQVFKLEWPAEGFEEVIMRVISINRGLLTDGEISVECVEDVYGMPDSSYVAPIAVGWTDPRTEPAEAAYRITEEATRYELSQTLSAVQLAAVDDDDGYMHAIAVRPSSDSIDFGLRTRTGANAYTEVGRGPFAPTATLAAALTPSQTSFTVANMDQAALVAEVGSLFASIDDEIIRIDTFNPVSGAITCGRGILDTVAAAHLSGVRVFFRDGFRAFDPGVRLDGETWNAKLTPRTGRGELAEGSAPADSIVFDRRAFRPYPPGKFRINTAAYPSTATAPLVVDWAHRNRLLQNLESEEISSITTEPAVTYNVRVYDADSAVLLDSSTGLTGTSWTSSLSGPYPLRVELESSRATYLSRQKHNWGTITFDGYTPGDARLAENGDIRIAETGDRRVTE